ncbi:TonB family protein [candidate division WOR-3 bacterium]|nr:TonB family protein [candidate division WOR-3 bacterium]
MKKWILFLTMFVFATTGFGKMTKVTPKVRKAILDTLKVDGVEIAVITMKNGEKIYIKFSPEDAPNTVKNFIMLANLGFYDGLTFHRVVPKFVVQGGDPSGDGTGDPGYSINAEFNKQRHLLGTLAMARSADPNSAGSQFYICLAPLPPQPSRESLDGKYTVFGQVIKGMDVVKRIKKGDVINSIQIERKNYDELRLLCKGTPESVIYKLPEPKSISLPDYPEELLDKNIEGKAWLRILLSKKGEALEVKLIESEILELNEKALEPMAKTWVFTPAKIAGIPISDWITVELEFKINFKNRRQHEAIVRAAGESKVIELWKK